MAVKITHYDIGDLWLPQATFTVGGTPTDPTNLTVRQQDAAGVETVLLNNVLVSTLTGSSTPIKKVSTGVFQANPGISLNASGYWFVRFEGTGAAVATEEQQAIVDPSEFTSDSGISTRALVGLSETKDWLQRQNIQTGEDLDLVRVINDVSDRIHQEAAREFKPYGTNPATRMFEIPTMPSANPVYVDGQFLGYRDPKSKTIRIGDLAATPTQVQIIDTDWTTVLQTVSSTDYRLLPLVRQAWEPYRQIEFKDTVTALTPGMAVTIAGTWGFPLVPGNIRQATLDAVASVMDRDVDNYRQDLGVNPQQQGGNTIVMAYGAQRLLSLPASASAVAWSYRDPAIG